MTSSRHCPRRAPLRVFLVTATLACAPIVYASDWPVQGSVPHTIGLQAFEAQAQSQRQPQGEPEREPDLLTEVQPEPADDAEPAKVLSEAKLRQLREQLLIFAPDVSMRSDLAIGVQSPKKVIEVLEAWSKKKDVEGDLFDADRTLQATYREFRAFLVKSYSGVIPALRTLNLPVPQFDPETSPELAIISFFAAAAIEIQKNNVVLSWCRQRDAASRAAYARIFPLLKRTAKGRPFSDRSVDVSYGFLQDRGGVFLEARNISGMTLTNVSLKVKLETLDGRACDHYYFIPVWQKTLSGENSRGFFLLIAADWWPIGAEATTRATVDLISDEILIAALRCNIDTHIPTAASRIMDELDRQLKTGIRMKLIMNRIEKIRSSLTVHPDLLKRAEQIDGDARTVYMASLSIIDKEIAAAEVRVAGLRAKQAAGRQSSGTAAQTKASIERDQRLLTELEAARRRLVKGEDTESVKPGMPRTLPRR